MTIRVLPGDCRDILPTLAADSIDACVTDPPYHLTSIVKRFGARDAAPAMSEGPTGVYRRASRGFMGQQWDGGDVAFRPETWAAVLRVLKPGAHLLAFSGTRTYHRMACAIEDAGFEIRDQVGWLYGSGFPKSHDVAKGIDRKLGAKERYRREDHPGRAGERKQRAPIINQANSATEENPNGLRFLYVPASEAAKAWRGWGTALKPAQESICVARKPLIGSVAENVLRHGTGALNIDGCRIEPSGADDYKYAPGDHGIEGRARKSGFALGAGRINDIGRWPANVIHDGSEEVLAAFPDAPGQQMARAPEHGAKKSVHCYGDFGEPPAVFLPRGDAGSAARFFYTAKADADDRFGAKHPTVKPVDLIAYLCRLITPPGGTVIDPFAGSGTLAAACLREKFNGILIEREPEYVADIEARIAHGEGRGGHSLSAKGRRVESDKASGADTPLFRARRGAP